MDPHESAPSNDTLIGSAVFAQWIRATNAPTHNYVWYLSQEAAIYAIIYACDTA